MDIQYWHKQTVDEPLFPDMLWNRPENRMYAGKILVVGGNLHGFSRPAEAYTEALKAGAGVARVLLPDALQKTVGSLFPDAEFAPSTPSGSFATKALAEVIAAAEWSDGVLLAGDFGKNAETTILLDGILREYNGILVFANDAIDYAISVANTGEQRQGNCFVMTIQDLQKYLVAAKYHQAVTSDIDLIRLITLLHELTTEWPIHIVLQHETKIIVASGGQVSTTPCSASTTQIAAHTSVWWLQNPQKPFEAFTTAIAELNSEQR